jgi:hypothetical protein
LGSTGDLLKPLIDWQRMFAEILGGKVCRVRVKFHHRHCYRRVVPRCWAGFLDDAAGALSGCRSSREQFMQALGVVHQTSAQLKQTLDIEHNMISSASLAGKTGQLGLSISWDFA